MNKTMEIIVQPCARGAAPKIAVREPEGPAGIPRGISQLALRIGLRRQLLPDLRLLWRRKPGTLW